MPPQTTDTNLANEAADMVEEKASQHHGNSEAEASNGQDMTPVIMPGGAATMKTKKQRRGNRSAAQRGPTALPRNRGTGFEEYYADPPMTPDEAEEERVGIYAKCLPFEERIQYCIQRFRARRRLQGEQTRFFDEYLFLGGVDTRDNAFPGLDTRDLKDLTPTQRREATATDTIHGVCGTDDQFYNGNDEHWSVDFAGVTAGYFSTSLSQLTGFEPTTTESLISLIENFLRYVLHHEVCPEFNDSVVAALEVCKQAREEWPVLIRLKGDLPGCFNLAATELFSTVESSDWSFLTFSRPAGFDPKTTFLAVCALCDESTTLDEFTQGTLKAAKERSYTLEVSEIEQPSSFTLDKFAALRIEGSGYNIEPVGKVFLKPAVIEDGWENPQGCDSAQDENIWVYLEVSLLANVVPKMKMDVTLVELSTGIRFIKTISSIVPSFYTFLPQQLMRHYKQPRDDDRPAPSIHDPVTDEVEASHE